MWGGSETNLSSTKKYAAKVLGATQAMSTNALFLTQRADFHPLYMATIAPLRTYLEFLWGGLLPIKQLAKGFASIVATINVASKPWAKVKGPVSATILSVRRIGWELLSPFTMVDHTGQQFSLWDYSPSMVVGRAKVGVLATTYVAAAKKFGVPIPETRAPAPN